MRVWPIGALIVLVCSGCGGSGIAEPDVAPVQGTVTINGTPAPGLDVLFTPVQGATQGKMLTGGMSTGRTDEQGRYKLSYKGNMPGAVIGKHSVQIRRDEANIDAPPGPAIPEKYGTNSTLTAEVQAGNNDIDFDLDVPE